MSDRADDKVSLRFDTMPNVLYRKTVKPTSFDQAFKIAMTLCIPPRTEIVISSKARNRILAADAVARINFPPFPRAMMDGYALRSHNVQGPETQFKVIDQMAAGDNRKLQICDGQAIRIATGAPLPEGADSVARFEWCRETGDGRIRLIHPIKKGESVQPVGDDAKLGQVLLHAGMRVNGARMAVCRGFGISEVTVTMPPTIAIIVTGSELVPNVHRQLEGGQIYASIDSYLTDALERDGITTVSVQYVGDDVKAITEAIAIACDQSDYVLVTGGVSAGDFDYVPFVLRKLGGELALERVLMRPGAPFIATRVNNATVFAMSGNPAACLIQFELFVRPAMNRSLGLDDVQFPASGKLRGALQLKPLKLVRILRAKAIIENGEVWVDTGMAQSPGVLSGFATANCLIRLDENYLTEGKVMPLRWLQ